MERIIIITIIIIIIITETSVCDEDYSLTINTPVMAMAQWENHGLLIVGLLEDSWLESAG